MKRSSPIVYLQGKHDVFIQRIIAVVIIVFMSNLSAIVEHFLNPEIPYFDPEHLIVGGVVGVFTILFFYILSKYLKHIINANEVQKKLIIELVKEKEKYKESDEKFKALFDNAPVGYHEIDLEGKIVRINETELNMLGYTIEELIGTPVWELNVDKDVSRKAIAEKLAGTIISTQPFERQVLCKDGTSVPVLIQDRILKDRHGKIIGISSTIQDIKLLKQVEVNLKESEKQLIQLNADKDRFMSILAHDLTSPFNALLGLSELLTNNIRNYDTDKIEKLASRINTSARNTFSLLENLLLWTRSQSGKLAYQPQTLSYNDICTDVVEMLKMNADAKNITINYFAADEITLIADSEMLKTVLRNLISNAIKFSNTGGKITIYAVQENSMTTISISDNGVGIKPDELSKLFNASEIYSTHGTANEKGTGLGLLLCKEFIEKHGGKIWVESVVGRGSEFKFTLPMKQFEGDS